MKTELVRNTNYSESGRMVQTYFWDIDNEWRGVVDIYNDTLSVKQVIEFNRITGETKRLWK